MTMICEGSETRLALRRAILIYEVQDTPGAPRSIYDRDRPCLATINDVRVVDGRPVIGAGRCVTADDLAALARAGQSDQARKLLPAHVLYADGGRVLWHRPAARRPVFFDTGRAAFDHAMRGKHPMWPPLLFLAFPGTLCVWALESDERPGPETRVMRAPCLNIYDSGRMCNGTAKLPLEVGLDVAPFERAFFETTFTHSNAARESLTAYKGGHDALWRYLAEERTEREWARLNWSKLLKPAAAPATVAGALNLTVRGAV